MKYTVQQQQHKLQLHLQLKPAELPADPVARQHELQRICGQILHANGWEPSREPQFEIQNETPQQIQIRCLIELFPKVTLPQHLEIALTAPAIDLPQEQELLERIQALQVRYGEQELLARPADWGDTLCVDWVGHCQGQLIPQSAYTDFWLLLHQESWASPLASALHGARAGEARSIQQKLASDFPYLPWRGKTAEYTVYVQSVYALRVPPASDLLAQISGLATDFDGLLHHLHTALREEKQASWWHSLREQVVAELVKTTRLQVPPEWVQDTLIAAWEATDQSILTEICVRLPVAAELLKTGLKTWLQQPHLYQQYERALATQLVLRAVAHRQQLHLADAEISQSLHTVGNPLNLSAERVWEAIQRDGQDHRFLNQLLLDKAANWLVRQAQIRYQDQILRIP